MMRVIDCSACEEIGCHTGPEEKTVNENHRDLAPLGRGVTNDGRKTSYGKRGQHGQRQFWMFAQGKL